MATEPDSDSSLGIRMALAEADTVGVGANESVAVDVESVEQLVRIARRIDVACRADPHQIDDPFGVLGRLTQVVPGDFLVVDVIE